MNIDPTLCTALGFVRCGRPGHPQLCTSRALSGDKWPAQHTSAWRISAEQLRTWFLRAEKHQDFTFWLWPYFSHRHWLTRVLLPSPHLPHGTGLSWELPPCVTEQHSPLLAI